jgi:hypothetical protein
VIVLLAGADPDAESKYRAAGLKHVLQMPVPLDLLLSAGSD